MPESPCATESGPRRRGLACVAGWAAPTAAASLLRFACLGRWSMWADEVATLNCAWQWREISGYPVGYFAVGLCTRAFGQGAFAARLAPALAGVLTVPILYFVARRMFGSRAACWTAWMLALSGYHIFFSQFCRYYSLVALFSLLAGYAFFAGVERADARRLAAAMLLLGLAFFTHWSAGMLAPAACVYILWRRCGPRRPAGLTWGHVVIVLAPMALAGIALAGWALVFLRGWGPWSFQPRAPALTLLKVADRFGPVVLALAALGAVWALRRRDPRGAWALCFAAIPVVGVTTMIAFSRGGTRFMICALPAVLLLAGDAMARLWDRRRGWAIAAACALLALLCGQDALYFFAERGQRPRWREAIGLVNSLRTRGALVATSPDIARYYRAGPAIDLASLPAVARFYEDRDTRELEAGLGRKAAGDLLRHIADGLWIAVERTRNVAPPPAMTDWIISRGKLVKDFPLRVRFLDYGVAVYRMPPPPRAPGNTRPRKL